MSSEFIGLIDPDRWILARSLVWFLQCAVVCSVALVGLEVLHSDFLQAGIVAVGVFFGVYLLFRQVNAFIEHRLSEQDR